MAESTPQDTRSAVGIRISELRVNLAISQEEFALRSRLDRNFVSGVENGRRNMSILNVQKLATALEVSLAEFFNSNLFEVI
jgi:transcriptional regulator with XRE-family HTH domain